MCLHPVAFLTLSVVSTTSEDLEHRRACDEGSLLAAIVVAWLWTTGALLGWWRWEGQGSLDLRDIFVKH